MYDSREKMIDILNLSSIDYDASDQDAVVIQTDQPNVFIEFVFWPGNGVLSHVALRDYNGMRSV